MNRKTRWKLSFSSGLFFGLFFFAGFGVLAGYSWFNFIVSMIGGMFFGASMYVFAFKPLQKPTSYYNKNIDKKLMAFESTLEESFTKYTGLTSFATRWKIMIVQVNIYLFAEYMIFSTYVQHEIKIIKETYDNIKDIVKGEDQIINITFADNSALFISLKNDEDAEQLLSDFKIKKSWYGVA